MYQLQFNAADRVPKVKQIVQSVISDIERGVLKNGNQLPSISELSEQYYIARDTVERAYRELRERGFITSVQGKGYYINSKDSARIKILLLFNRMNSYNREIYNAFLEALQGKASVELQIFHYDAGLFHEIVERNLGKYNYYVVMPHFAMEASESTFLTTLNLIPEDELVLLDKDIPELKHDCLRVVQDFERDVYQALHGLSDLLANYPRMVLVQSPDNGYPPEIARGFRSYCIQKEKELHIRESAQDEVLEPGTCYFVIRETDLVVLMKRIRQLGFLVGRNIGVLTFNETPLKDLLNLTVLTTEFQQMGQSAGRLLLEKHRGKIKNPFSTIRRHSL
ncbi:GntR family transcriptional regulator [Hymenobacter agri]